MLNLKKGRAFKKYGSKSGHWYKEMFFQNDILIIKASGDFGGFYNALNERIYVQQAAIALALAAIAVVLMPI